MKLWKRMRALFARERMDREFDEEIRSHIDLATDDYVQRGYSTDEARRLARVKFGAVESAKDAHRDSRGFAWMEELRYNLRFAVRGIIRDRLFAFATVTILALAIGVNVTAFWLMDATMFRGYPMVKDNRRLLLIDERYPGAGCCVTFSDFDAWRASARSFEGMSFSVYERLTFAEEAQDVRDVEAIVWTPNSFGLLGVKPALGRDFVPADAKAGAERAIILNHRYWLTRMGGRADVIGRRVLLNKSPARIIGVMPSGFEFPQKTDMWLPLVETAELHRGYANGSYVFGRLADGASEESARAEVEAINARLAVESPSTNRDVQAVAQNFMVAYAGSNARLIYGSLWAGTWLVLLIGCANLANLALARAQGRVREMCTRMALGAGRARVLRQWFVESFLLAAAGGLLAGWISAWGIHLWKVVIEAPYQARDYSVSAATVAYVVAVTLIAAVVITLVPVSRMWKLDVNGALKGEARGGTMNLQAKHLSAALVTGQMALAIVLLSGAGVLAHSLWNVLTADVGVREPQSVLMGKITLPSGKYPTLESRTAYFDAVNTRLASMPGISSAAIANGQPVADFEPRRVDFEGKESSLAAIPTFSLGPGYFSTVGARVFAGRDFTSGDRMGGEPVAIVNQRFVDTYFPGQSAIGKRIRMYAKRELVPSEWRTIVGVVSNVMQNDVLRQNFRPVVYLPFAQEPWNSAWFFARVPDVSDGIAAVVRAEVQRVDPGLEIAEFKTLEDGLGYWSPQNMTSYRNLAKFASVAPIVAIIALLLAAAGLYAVVARSVGQRTKEIGVRMALGAGTPEIRRLVLREGMAPVVFGVSVGLIAALAVNRVLQSQLVGVSPYDVVTFTMGPLVLALVALLGCLFPLRQAVRVDPAVALRHD